jgi:hypothetical protein
MGEKANEPKRNNAKWNTNLKVNFGFRVAREVHDQIKKIGLQKKMAIRSLYVEAAEQLLEKRSRGEISYFSPPIGSMAILVTLDTTTDLYKQLQSLGQRDERSLGSIMETAALLYLES